MKGSTVSGVNPKKFGGAGKGTTKANTGVKSPGVKKAVVAPNQKLKLKGSGGNFGIVQGLSKSIHKNRGGSLMKRLFK